MKRLLYLTTLSLAAAFAAHAQCPPQTVVADTIHNADGSLAEGRVIIAWPTFQAGACQVVAGQASVTITAGALSVPLFPNDAATPAGTSYRVTYHLKSGRVTTEYWVVPASGSPVTLAIVRSPSVPVPTVMVSQAQVTNLVAELAGKLELPAACPSGKFLQSNGAAMQPQVACVDGTGAPLASSTQSGTVKTDVNQADPLVYTKASADALFAGKAAAAHAHAAADTTIGVFDPARLPAPTASTLGGVRSGACSGSDKMNGISTAGAIQCAPDQIGGSGGSQHQVNGGNLAANDPVNFQDSASIAFSNPSAGNVQAALKDNSVTAAKLAVANPSGAQLSGIGDANIASGVLSPNRIAGTAEVQSNKGASGGYASLNGSSLVVQNPASAQGAPAASKIPIADGAGKLDDGWLSASVSLLGPSVSLASEVTGVLPDANIDAAITRDSEWPSASATLTNKTIDAEGTGNTVTLTSKVWLAAAACQNTTASLLWDTPTANIPTAICNTGANTQKGAAQFPDSDGDFALFYSFPLPGDFTGAIDAKFKWYAAATTGDVVWQLATACVADGETSDPSFNTASTVADTAKATTLQDNDATITSVTITGCAPGEMLYLKLLRNRTHASDSITGTVQLRGLELTLRRAQ